MRAFQLADRSLDVTLAGRFAFGAGSVAGLPDALRQVGAERVLLVTDAGVVAAGIAGRVVAALDGAGLRVTAFDGVEPNPTIATVGPEPRP